MAEHDTGEKPKWSPPGTEWGIPPELLASIYDRLGEVVRAIQNGYAATPIREGVRPYPRPVTEIDRAKKRADEQADRALDDLIRQAQATHSKTRGTVTPDD